MLYRRTRVERTRAGDFRLRLSGGEREVLRALPSQLRDLLDADDPSLRRLFPPAYPDDPEAEAEYGALQREELLQARLEALAVLERTVDAERLTEPEAEAWLGAINDVRLVLGTQLDVTEETSQRLDLRDRRSALYLYLGWLQEQLVEALAER